MRLSFEYWEKWHRTGTHECVRKWMTTFAKDSNLVEQIVEKSPTAAQK